jgi:hypothetical protein
MTSRASSLKDVLELLFDLCELSRGKRVSFS